MLLNSLIEGKSITRFPVYLRSKSDPSVVQVAKSLDDIQKLLKRGKWINAGPAPFDNNRAIGTKKPKSNLTATKTFEIFRIVERNGNVLKLFPEGELAPAVQWLQFNRPKVGGYLLRHDNDYYTAISETVFNRQYAKGVSEETLQLLKDALKKTQPTAKSAKGGRSEGGELHIESASVESVPETVMEELKTLFAEDSSEELSVETVELGSSVVEETVEATDNGDTK